MDLPSRVGPKVNVFGTFLLNDDDGNKVANITERCHGDQQKIVFEVLREWLAGKGVEVSWNSLIATLRDCELSLIAEQIQMALYGMFLAMFILELIAEYLSTRQLILRRISEIVCMYVCMYPSRLGIHSLVPWVRG